MSDDDHPRGALAFMLIYLVTLTALWLNAWPDAGPPGPHHAAPLAGLPGMVGVESDDMGAAKHGRDLHR